MPTYTRKRLHNIAAIDKEQERIKKMYRDMEKNWVSNFLNPQAIAINALSGLIFGSKRKKNKKNKDTLLSSDITAQQSNKNALGVVASIMRNDKVKSIATATGKSWLRWQVFNLAFYLSKKLYNAASEKIKEKKAEKKLQKVNHTAKRKIKTIIKNTFSKN